MTSLDTFSRQRRVAVIGASGGIGQALAALFAEDPQVEQVFAVSRSPCILSHPKIVRAEIDLEDETSISDCAATVSTGSFLDIVVVATGVLGCGETTQPEKSMRELNHNNMAKLFSINAIGPALVAKHFLPKLRKGSKTVFAALSARVGSIGDNRLGGWYSYRASKAALNMLLKTLAIERARVQPGSIVIGLHPGTVDTKLSAPYTGRTPADKIFSPVLAATHLASVLNKVRAEDSGGVFAWDGQRIAN